MKDRLIDALGTALLACLVVGLIAWSATLDSGPWSTEFEEAAAAEAVDAQAWEAARQADLRERMEAIRTAYEQGLREGAAGALAAAGRQQSLQAAQACAAMSSALRHGPIAQR